MRLTSSIVLHSSSRITFNFSSSSSTNMLISDSWVDGVRLSCVEGVWFTLTLALSSAAAAGVGGEIMGTWSGSGAVAAGVEGVFLTSHTAFQGGG